MPVVRLALAQMNAVVGDFVRNVETLDRFRHQAANVGADLLVTPELSLTGYPPEDLLLKEGFIDAADLAMMGLRDAEGLPAVVLGTVVSEESGVRLAPTSDARNVVSEEPWPHVANALVALNEGVLDTATKRLLPNYEVFDEQRYFHAGVGPHSILNVKGVSVGLLICEDVWMAGGPAKELAAQGASVIVVANASPFARGRREEREAMLVERARETGCPIAYVNLVGGQDELVFDGQSVVVDATGAVIGRARAFTEELLVVDVEARASEVGVPVRVDYPRDERRVRAASVNAIAEPASGIAEVYEALVMGTRDYLWKNGFRSVVLGVSGGIDSSLVATLAVDAVGARAVKGVAMPSRYSSSGSLSDALELGARLDIEVLSIPIEVAHSAFTDMLKDALGETPHGLTDENLQSRIRGVILMAISNATGAIVLTTGNKSEMAVGYSTLYGDSAGGFAVIKDVPKTMVYELCRYRNSLAREAGDPEPISDDVLTKAPSAELRPNQRDDQSLPPYELLDPLLEGYIDRDATAGELIAEGHDPALVARVARLVDAAEYKRRQSPPGVRISKKAFGRDRRMPITNGFRTPLS